MQPNLSIDPTTNVSKTGGYKVNSLEIAQENVSAEESRHLVNSISYTGEFIITQANQNDNYALGATFAIASAVFYSLMVVFAKLAYSLNSSLTSYDLWVVRGIITVIWFSIYAYIKKINLLNFDGKPILCISVSLFDAIALLLNLTAMKYISATKWVLILNWNPILTVFLAMIILKENVSKYDKIGVVLMVIGWITISINKTSIPADIDDPILGYTFTVISAIIISLISIGLRIMNQNTHPLIFPYYFIIFLMLICILAFFFDNESLNFDKFKFDDFMCWFASGFSGLFAIAAMSLSFKYAEAAQILPLNSIENIFNWIGEYFILGYIFGVTDLFGAAILIVAFMLPIISKTSLFIKQKTITEDINNDSLL